MNRLSHGRAADFEPLDQALFRRQLGLRGQAAVSDIADQKRLNRFVERPSCVGGSGPLAIDIGILRSQIHALAEGARKQTEFPTNNRTPDNPTLSAARQHADAEFVLKNGNAALAAMRRPTSLRQRAKRFIMDAQSLPGPPAIRRTPQSSASGGGGKKQRLCAIGRWRWRTAGSLSKRRDLDPVSEVGDLAEEMAVWSGLNERRPIGGPANTEQKSRQCPVN